MRQRSVQPEACHGDHGEQFGGEGIREHTLCLAFLMVASRWRRFTSSGR